MQSDWPISKINRWHRHRFWIQYWAEVQHCAGRIAHLQKQFVISSERFVNVPSILEQWLNQSVIGQTYMEIPIEMHNAEFTMAIDELISDLFCWSAYLWWSFLMFFFSMTNCQICHRIVMEPWPKAIEKRVRVILVLISCRFTRRHVHFFLLYLRE